MDTKKTSYTIAFIESNTTGSGEKFVELALRSGYKVLFLTSNPDKYLFIRKHLIQPVLIDTTDLEVLYEYLRNQANLKAVISTSENFIYAASYVARRLSLPSANPVAIENCRNKFLLGELLAKADLDSIRTKLVHDPNDVMQALENFTMPVVVKPNYGTGSIGVKLCVSSDEVFKHCQRLNNKSLIQEYIQGDEYSVEIIVLKNNHHLLGITKKYLGQAPYFVETGHEFPAALDSELKDKIFKTMVCALQAVGFDFGPVHIEFRLLKEKIYIIEINPRLAGGMIPLLIEQAQGIHLIENILNLYLGNVVDFAPKASLITKIAFVIPKTEGELIKVDGLAQVKQLDNIVDVGIYKNAGDEITLKGDFSDRIGYVVAKSKHIEECRAAIAQALNKLQVHITVDAKKNQALANHARNRLSASLDRRVKKILQIKLLNELIDLKLLSDINKAHVLMLNETGIISTEQAQIIIKGVLAIEENDFSAVTNNYDASIGYYLTYEQALIDKIGMKNAGNLHMGRSRNDINATVQRLKSREIFTNIYAALWQLRSQILQVAARFLTTAMPLYSQYQPAMPGTYAYYLLAIENVLALTQTNLRQSVQVINTATLGASAGAGTIFPIDPHVTAKLLGFEDHLSNALTVVASRDLELMLLSNGAMLGMNISRIAQDYQLWTTLEFNLVNLPDSLCGISSSMPQKKNPYLLEKIKGKAIAMSGTLNTALAIMSKTPFANSVEVGTEALINYVSAFDELIKAIKLIEIIIQEATPIMDNVRRTNLEGLTIATAVAESLTQNNKDISYRQAHTMVGKTIADALAKEQSPLDSILQLENNLSGNPEHWHLLFEYGGGPGKASTENMLKKAEDRLEIDAEFFRDVTKKWKHAENLLSLKTCELINHESFKRPETVN